MKRFRYLIASVLLICLSAMLLLCACGGEGSSSGSGSPAGNTSAGEVGGLVFNKKYVYGAFGENRENYFLFRSDGTGDYVRNRDYDYAAAEHYTMHFKWFYADKEASAVVCFYDGVEYGQGHKGVEVSDDTKYLVTVSEYVLCSNDRSPYAYYINEDHVGELTNYGKE